MLRLVTPDAPTQNPHTDYLEAAASETEVTAIALGRLIAEHGEDSAAPFVDYLRMARFAMVSAHLALSSAAATSKEQ